MNRVFFAALAMLIVGCAVMLFGGNGPDVAGWTPASQMEKAQLIGAAGLCQRCPSTLTFCPPPPTPGASKCVGNGWTCELYLFGNYRFFGCSSPGQFYECQWAWNWTCWNGSTQKCGTAQFLRCPGVLGGCFSPTPEIWDSGNSCRSNCT